MQTIKLRQFTYLFSRVITYASYFIIVLYLLPKTDSLLDIALFLCTLVLIHTISWFLKTFNYNFFISQNTQGLSKTKIEASLKETAKKLIVTLPNIDQQTNNILHNRLWKQTEFQNIDNNNIISLQEDWHKYSKEFFALQNQLQEFQKLTLHLKKKDPLKKIINTYITQANTKIWNSFTKIYKEIIKHHSAKLLLQDFQSYQLVTSHFFTARELLLLLKNHPKLNKNHSTKTLQQYSETTNNLKQIRANDLLNYFLRLINTTSRKQFYPIQKKLSLLISKSRLPVRDKSQLKKSHIQQTIKTLESLDVLVLRNNWQVSNMFLPGFWTHSLIYLGSIEELIQIADNKKVRRYLKRNYHLDDLRQILARDFPKCLQKLEHNKFNYIDSTAEGVEISNYKKQIKAEYLAAIRPIISPKQKIAIFLEILTHYHKPYDFDFDYRNSNSLVCSELIYKAYKSHSRIPLKSVQMAGRYTIPPSNFIKSLFTQSKRKPYWEFVFFADGIPNLSDTKFQTLEELSKTLDRPTSDLLLEKTSFWRHLLKLPTDHKQR